MRLERIIGARKSLMRSLVVNVVLALLVCTVLAMVILLREFYSQMDDTAHDALMREAEEVAAEIDPTHPLLGQDPDELRFVGDGGAYRYTIFGADWLAVLGNELADAMTPDLKARLEAAEAAGAMIDLGQDRTAVVLRRELPAGAMHVLASTRSARAGQSDWQVLQHEVEEQLGWILFGGLVIVAAAIFAARRSLRPLKLALSQARAIAPGAPERRLATDPLPTELRPLISAVNNAFDRLEQGYQAQRDFSSNVAHEVRTPLAVLRSGIETIADPQMRGELSEDLGRLDRMFEQLIDLARADALPLTGRSDVDLHDIALDLATTISVQALRAGRS
ncbi:MAG: histidine kinase dimerization/phospho-acceptor domain-containing protein, partial [Erythrobacter sp.]|nr:histidine kinase dimerization/phospho-acceptor domain-containing protein [Erythrobacter sp.]